MNLYHHFYYLLTFASIITLFIDNAGFVKPSETAAIAESYPVGGLIIAALFTAYAIGWIWLASVERSRRDHYAQTEKFFVE